MKKIHKRLLALLMVLSMAVLATACVVPTTQPPTTQPTAVPAEPTKAPTPTPVPERYEAFDFGGRTIKVGVWWDFFYTSKHTAITDDPGMTNSETATMKLLNVRRIEQKYNCKIEYVNLGWDPIIASINTSIAAGAPECDLYLTDLQFGIPAAINGLAQDLKKIAPKNSDMFNEKKIFQPLEALGATYFVKEQGLPQDGIFLGYNATMINELGLEDPQALFNKGQWNWEKFAEYCKAGTRDTDNDGTTDIYGFGGVFPYLINGLVMNNGGEIATSKTEGLSSKEVVETFEFINRLYNVDNSARPWNAADWNDNLLAWSDGKVMFYTGVAWLNSQEITAAANEGGKIPFDFHVAPYPQGPGGDGNIYTPCAGNWYIVPVGVKEPTKVLQIFEEYMNWHNGQTELRDDPSWFESCFLTEADVEMAFKCGQNMKVDLWDSLKPTFDMGSIWWPVIVDKTSTVSQAIEAAKPTLQDALNTFFK